MDCHRKFDAQLFQCCRILRKDMAKVSEFLYALFKYFSGLFEGARNAFAPLSALTICWTSRC